MAKSMDGEIIKVGDFVGFKNGIEQYGKVISVNSNSIVISIYDANTGDRYEIDMLSNQCWVE